MPQWNYRIKIRQFLREGESKEDMLKAVQGIRAEVSKLPDGLIHRGADQPLRDMENAAKAGKLAWFNASLDELWDFFDYHRIWVEF